MKSEVIYPKHKVIDLKDKLIGMPDMKKSMSTAELKAAVVWLFQYLGIKM